VPSPASSEQEEFEFRLRAEQEAGASATPQNKTPSGANAPRTYTDISGVPRTDAGGKPEPEERGPVGDVMAMVGAIPQGVGQAATGIANAASDPLGAIKSAVTSPKLYDAVMHPVDTVSNAVSALPNVPPEQVGGTIGSSLLGGAAGKAAGVLGDVAGPTVKALNPLQKPVSQTVRDLANKLVVTTPGQRGGKIASAIEQRATSIPLVGDMIKRARGKATEQWNRAELNEAIKDAGGAEIPKNRTGRDAIAHTQDQMHEAYNRVLGKMTGDLNSADPSGMTFRQFLDQTKTLTTQSLEPQTAKTVNGIIDNKVIMKFGQNGKATGERIKEIQEALRTEINDLKSGNYQDRKAAEALKQVSADMKAMLKRENPKLAAELDDVDKGYAKFKASSKASLYSTKNQGAYTPAQKLQAIKSRDKSKDKQQFASGHAPGEKDAEAVESVIGNTEPDSGSAGRIATMEAIFTGGGAAAGHPLIGAAMAAAPLLYSQPVLKYLQNRALKKGGPYKPITKAAPIGAAAGAIDSNGVAQ
jgi:hypothetical protein